MTDTAQVISAKTLVWKTSASSNVQYFLLVLNLQDYVNLNQVENYLKERIRLASKEQAEILTKQKIGSILPFLPSSREKVPGLRVLIDEKLVEHPDCIVRFIHTTQQSTKSNVSSSLADDAGGKMIIEISALELVRITDGEIVSLSSNSPIRSDFLEEQSIGRNFSKSVKPTHKNDSDDSIMYFSPSQLRKIAMTSDYAKMVQVLSALRHQQFHSSYSFPNYFTMSDHVNVASRSGGKTAIQLACWKGSLPIIQLLLQFGANLNQYSTNEHNYGKTAIFYAITQCRDDVVLYLLKDHSPNLLIVNNKGQTPLSLAITHLSEETIRIVEEKEKLLEESKQYEWMNFYDSEHRGRGVFGDLDPRFISRSHYREIVDTLLTIRSKRDEKDLLQPNEAEDGDRLSSLAISRILMSTEDDTRSFFLETDELEARSEETKFARIVPIFPTTLETRRNIRSVYMIQQLQGQLESNTSKLIADQQSTSSAPGRSKSQKFLRHKALEEEKLIFQEFSGDVLPSAHHDSNIIDIHHRGHMTLKGIITAKRQLSNKLVFLNISPNQSLLNSSTPHFTASQLRYSWRTADAGLVETKNYYAIQLIVGKTFRSNLEDLYQQKETTSSTTNAGNGTVMMEKVCKIMKVGHVIEIDGEIKSVQERTNPILPSTGLYSSKTLGGDVEAKEEKYFEVEMIVHRLRFIGAEIVPTLPDLIDKVPDLGNSSPTANISLITSKNEAKQKKMKSEKIESGPPLVKTQTVETEYVNLKDLTFFVDHFANPSLEKYINTKDPVYLLDWNHSNDIQHFISIMRTTFDYLQHSPSSVDSSMSLSIDPRQLIGIDCEWKPEHYDLINSKNADTENSLKEKSDIQQLEQNLDNKRNKKENRNAFLRINPVEIMQISTIYGVFLFDMRRLFPATDEYHTNHDEEVKEDLRKVLLSLFEHQRLYKIGFELHQDLERLFSSYHWLFFPSESSNERNLNFSIKSIIDINSLTKVMVSSLRGFHKQHRWSGLSKSDYTSLSKLTKLLFNFEKTLNKEQQCSAWHERPLSEAQIEYAALDAAILIELFQRLTAEILEVHSHHTVHGFLQKQNLIINLKFQLFTHQAILESYYDYFGLIDESFTKTRPRHHILFEEPHGTRKRILLIHEKCSSNQHHTETNSLSNHPWLFYKKNRPRTRSRSFESKDGSEHETTEKCKESITVLPIEDSPEGEEFRKAFIGKMVGKSKDYCLKLFEQWYYSHQTSVGLISKQSGFYVVNQRHIVIFINLLSPSAKFQATSYDNIFFDKGKYFNFYVLRKQLEQFSPVNSDGGMLNQNDFQDLLKGSPKREFHLFLRPEGMRAFFYSGKCRLIPPSDLLDSLMQMKEDEGRKTIDGNSRLSKGVTSTISESLFKEFFLELTDHDDYLAQNFEFETMIEHHSHLQRVRFERK